jgi:glycosyltransferase involved in cell wall biosynthesis
VRSGIADYARDLVSGLAPHHDIDVVVASPAERAAGAAPGVQLLDPHDFPWRQARAPYDLVIYQLGNAWCHDYMWPYLFRYPGLVVLHDGALHHSRAWALLRRRRTADYRAELAFNHPELPPQAAELAIHGFSGPIYYDWSMLRAVVGSARTVAVHSPHFARELAAGFPDAIVETVAMGVPEVVHDEAATAGVRARHGIANEAFVVGAFGGITPEKRIGPLLRAASVARRYDPALRILLVGATHLHYDVMAEAEALGVANIVTVTGYVDETELPAYLSAVDVVSALRFPSARETSASWLRALAAGRPTLVTDLAQSTDLPTIDPRSGAVVHSLPTTTAPAPVAISIDVLDEVHCLTLVLKRLPAEAELRRRLGENGRSYWKSHHTIDHMVRDYDRVMTHAASQPPPDIALPAHLRPDGLEHARALAASLGIALPDGLQ